MRKNNTFDQSIRHNKPVRVPFHALVSQTLSTGSGSVGLGPAQFTRPAAIAEVYELYRIPELEFRLHPDTASNGIQVAAMIPGVVDTPPTTFVTASESLNACVLGQRSSQPTEWVKCQSRDLMSYMSWYKTVIGSPDTDVEIQGAIYLVGGSTDTIKLEVRGVFEFKNPVGPGQTPMVRELVLARERERILKILASSPSSTTAIGVKQLPQNK